MKYRIIIKPQVEKKIKKLDRHIAEQITKYLKKNILENDNVLDELVPLTGNLKGYYKIKPMREYRILASIESDILTIYLLDLEQRKKSYSIWNRLKKGFFR